MSVAHPVRSLTPSGIARLTSARPSSALIVRGASTPAHPAIAATIAAIVNVRTKESTEARSVVRRIAADCYPLREESVRAREQKRDEPRRHDGERDMNGIAARRVRHARIEEVRADHAEKNRRERIERHAKGPFGARVPCAQYEQRDSDEEQECPEHRSGEFHHRFEAV